MTTPTVLEIIKRARHQIRTANRWTKNCSARSSSGVPVDPTSKSATRWCADGAIFVSSGYHCNAYMRAAMVLEDIGAVNIFEFNDNHTHAQVIELFDRVIAKLEPTAP